MSRDKYCALIVLSPRWSIAYYLDVGNQNMKRDYTRIKSVLDEALEGYARKGGHFEKNSQSVTKENTQIGRAHV